MKIGSGDLFRIQQRVYIRLADHRHIGSLPIVQSVQCFATVGGMRTGTAYASISAPERQTIRQSHPNIEMYQILTHILTRA